MKSKSKIKINGVSDELAALMQKMKVESWETRKHSRGAFRLYIRCVPVLPEVRMSVVR